MDLTARVTHDTAHCKCLSPRARITREESARSKRIPVKHLLHPCGAEGHHLGKPLMMDMPSATQAE